RLGEARDEREVGGAVGRGPRGGVGRRSGGLDLEQHRGAFVFDGLEAADRAAELHAELRVRDARLEAALCAADLLRGERRTGRRPGGGGTGGGPGGGEDPAGRAFIADAPGGAALEAQRRQLARRVDRLKRASLEPLVAAVDGE